MYIIYIYKKKKKKEKTFTTLTEHLSSLVAN